DKTALKFGATISAGTLTQQTAVQTIRLLQTGTGPVTWTAAPSAPWLTVTPASGSGAATLSVAVKYASSLPVGSTSVGKIALAFSGAANATGTIDVSLQTISGADAAPSGAVDTPVDGTTGITGSLPVTGWAIDDVEVRSVRITRDPVAGEGSAQIFIGNA